MPLALTIAPMVAEDLPEVMEIERVVFPSPWSSGLFLHELKIPFSRLRVARTANGARTLLGYVCWWVVGDEVHLLNLAVRPDCRRGGIGRQLVQLVLDDAVAHDAASISLEVRRENRAALCLYERMGFTERGVRKDYYGRGEHAIIMTRDLRSGPPRPVS